MRILGVNGIHNWSWSDDSFTDQMLDALSDEFFVVDVKYERMTAFMAYFSWFRKRVAKKILAEAKETDCLVAHSFGCLASIEAMRMGAKFDKVFFFGAAVERDADFPDDAFNWMYNIHSANDTALVLGDKLPFHEFGTMGRDGYIGSSHKVRNVSVTGLDHNDYVKPKNLCNWVKFIKDRV